jgi:hypothetical protein
MVPERDDDLKNRQLDLDKSLDEILADAGALAARA